MKKKLITICITVFLIVLVYSIIIKFKSRNSLVNWNGNFIEFFVRDRQPKLGILKAPSTLEEAAKKHLILPGSITLDKRGGRFSVPEKAWFVDIEEFGAVFYKNNSEDSLYGCDVYFFKETPDQFIELYQKIHRALEEGLGDFGGGPVTGDCGVEFISQIHSAKEFPTGFQVESNSWTDPANRWGIGINEFYEVADGFLGIEGWEKGYVMGVYIVWLHD